jgi:hypothetical protein
LEILIDLSREEVAIAKRYPACTALCIRDGWELCRPENAAGIHFAKHTILVLGLDFENYIK